MHDHVVLPAIDAGPSEDDKQVDLRKLLQKVATARVGSPQLDNEFVSTFHSAPPNVTRSIDAAVRLIENELPGWWWNCGYCELRNGASLYVPGPSRIRANFPGAKISAEYGSDSAELRLLQDPKWGPLFDSGFHCDRGGTVPLAMLAVFLEAKIALSCVQLEASVNNAIHAGRTRGPNPDEVSTISAKRRATAPPGPGRCVADDRWAGKGTGVASTSPDHPAKAHLIYDPVATQNVATKLTP